MIEMRALPKGFTPNPKLIDLIIATERDTLNRRCAHKYVEWINAGKPVPKAAKDFTKQQLEAGMDDEERFINKHLNKHPHAKLHPKELEAKAAEQGIEGKDLTALRKKIKNTVGVTVESRRKGWRGIELAEPTEQRLDSEDNSEPAVQSSGEEPW